MGGSLGAAARRRYENIAHGTLAGRLEWLPDLVGGLVFGWMTLGSCTLAWDFVLKGAIKDAVEHARREARDR